MCATFRFQFAEMRVEVPGAEYTDRLRGRGPGRMYRKGDGRRLATFTSLPHSLTHSPLGLSSPHCQRTDSRSRQIICECGALSQPSPSPLPRCRRSRRRPSFSIPHPLTLTHTLPSQLPHPHILPTSDLTPSNPLLRKFGGLFGLHEDGDEIPEPACGSRDLSMAPN